MMDDLFSGLQAAQPQRIEMADGAWLLRHHALDGANDLMREIDEIAAAAPFRHMVTPGGFSMSVAMTNCGPYGWVTDRRGYRYQTTDPEWKTMALYAAKFSVACHERGEGGGLCGFHAQRLSHQPL